MSAILDFLGRLPHLPISTEGRIVLSALVISLATALGALIRNRRLLRTPVDDEAGDMGAIFDNPSSIMPHVIELRNRVIASLIAIAVATFLSAALTDRILTLLAAPIGGVEALQAIRVTENVSVFFRVALTVGIILASPYVIAQLWIFIAAGLKPSERRLFYLLFPFATVLFMSGVAFAYLVMLPVAVPFLTNFMGITAKPTLDDYVKFVTNVLLWVGASFELPMIVFVLAKLGIVNAGMLARNWRFAVVIIVIIAAVVTPTPDPINMGIMSAPLLGLYLLSIVLALVAQPKAKPKST